MYSDHQALTAFHNQKSLSNRQARYMMELAEYGEHLDIKYLAGHQNSVADCWSMDHTGPCYARMLTDACLVVCSLFIILASLSFKQCNYQLHFQLPAYAITWDCLFISHGLV